MKVMGRNRFQTPLQQNIADEGDFGAAGLQQENDAGGDTNVLSPTSSSQPPSSNASERGIGRHSSCASITSIKADEIRQKCRNSLLEKTPKIFMERLKTAGSLLLENLTVLEVQLVNYNPEYFRVFMNLPKYPVPMVKMVGEVAPELLDITGKSGNLRHAFDEEFSYLTTSELVFSRTREDVRACAVMAFVPPRCFILCDETGIQNEDRLLSINNGLKRTIRNGSVSGSPNIKPGEPLVGVRMGTYMRVAVLQGDVKQPGRILCVCLDYNAVYSFGRDELFSLPDEFSVDEVPTNAFLARIRGTHYVYPDMYEAVNNEMCRLNGSEGVVPLVTCAIYGRAPDLLTIVDICMSMDEGWVSERLVDLNIAAPFEPDSCVKITPFEAEEMLKDRRRREVARAICSDPATEEEPDIPVKNRNNIVCGHCGSEVAIRREPVDKKAGLKINLPEGISLSKRSNEERLQKSGCGADYPHVSLTEQLMSVAKQMRAKNEQDRQWSISSEAQERSAMWTPQPEKEGSPFCQRAEPPPPRRAEPPSCKKTKPLHSRKESVPQKTDNSSWDDVQISGTKWPWESESDAGTPPSEQVATTGTCAVGRKKVASTMESDRLSPNRIEPPPPSMMQRPIPKAASNPGNYSEATDNEGCEGKENKYGSVPRSNKPKKKPQTIDYLSSENVDFGANTGEEVAATAGQGSLNAGSVTSEITGQNECERFGPVRAEPPPPSQAKQTTSKIVWSSKEHLDVFASKKAKKPEPLKKDNVESDKQKCAPATVGSEILARVATKNVERGSSEESETFGPQRAVPPPPSVLQSTAPKSASKSVEVVKSLGDKSATAGSVSANAISSVTGSEAIAAPAELKRFSAPTVCPQPPSEPEDAKGEDESMVLYRLLDLYNAARSCSKEPSSRIEYTDLSIKAVLINAGRALLGNPETEKEKQILKDLLSIADAHCGSTHM